MHGKHGDWTGRLVEFLVFVQPFLQLLVEHRIVVEFVFERFVLVVQLQIVVQLLELPFVVLFEQLFQVELFEQQFEFVVGASVRS